jgi:SAM-dependent methyltransferase
MNTLAAQYLQVCNSFLSRYPSKDNVRQMLQRVNQNISPQDGMYEGDMNAYVNCGLSAIVNIEHAIATSGNRPIRSALDFASGYGRVLRHLVVRFPDAEVTASDIEADAVSFCATNFGVNGVVSTKNLNELAIGRTFDLIWSGSLMTHLDCDGAVDLLNFFHKHTVPGGLAVFTTHGNFAICDLVEQWKEVLENATDGHPYGLYQADVETIVSQFNRTGYGYAVYYGQDRYGISACSLDWLQRTVTQLGGWRLVYFRERGWNDHQDVVGLVKC